MGRIPDKGLVRWAAWEELATPPASLFADFFVRAYTLAQYRKWIDIQPVELEDICQRIVKFGKVLAGLPDDHLLLPFTELVLRQVILFWDLKPIHQKILLKQGYLHSSMRRLCRSFLHLVYNDC